MSKCFCSELLQINVLKKKVGAGTFTEFGSELNFLIYSAQLKMSATLRQVDQRVKYTANLTYCSEVIRLGFPVQQATLQQPTHS